MAHKMAIHAENYKKGSVGALQHHNLRENETYSNGDIDKERIKDNLLLKKPYISQFQDTKSMIESRAVNQVRATSIWQSEFIISSGKELFQSLSRAEQDRFFQEAYTYLCKEFGEENVTCAVVHYDETTPHMHFDFVPMTKENKLSRKEVMTRERLRKIQDDMPRYMQEKGFDVERGRKMSDLEFKERPRHIEPKDYKKALEGQIRALEAQKKMLDDELQKQQQNDRQRGRRLQEREKKVRARYEELSFIEKNLSQYSSELKAKMEDYNNQIKNIGDIPKGKRVIGGSIVLTEPDYVKLVSTAKNGIISYEEQRQLKESVTRLTGENKKLKGQVMPMEQRIKINKKLSEVSRLEKENAILKQHNGELMRLAGDVLALTEKLQLPDMVWKLLKKMVGSTSKNTERDMRER